MAHAVRFFMVRVQKGRDFVARASPFPPDIEPMRARLLIAALLPVFSISAPLTAHAAICESLRAQLNQLPEISGNTAEVRRYANALAHQNLNIRKVRNDLQRYGCSTGSFTVIGGRNQEACDQLQSSLADMEANRRYLETERDAVKNTVSTGSGERRRILAALQENGCDGTVREASFVTPSPLEKDESAFFTRIPSPGNVGQLRTMCVRTCDGSFFPISSNASTDDFQRDAAICNNMCPGAETKLYYHSLTDSESADMVSATTGEPYRALPSAFAYRNRLPGEKPVCGCGAGSAFTEEADPDSTASASKDLRPALKDTPKPVQSPIAEAAATTVPDRPYEPEKNKVRVVGPQFEPSSTGNLNLGNGSQVR